MKTVVVKSLKSHGKLAQGPHVTVAWLQEHFSYLAARFTLVCSGVDNPTQISCRQVLDQ